MSTLEIEYPRVATLSREIGFDTIYNAIMAFVRRAGLLFANIFGGAIK